MWPRSYAARPRRPPHSPDGLALRFAGWGATCAAQAALQETRADAVKARRLPACWEGWLAIGTWRILRRFRFVSPPTSARRRAREPAHSSPSDAPAAKAAVHRSSGGAI